MSGSVQAFSSALAQRSTSSRLRNTRVCASACQLRPTLLLPDGTVVTETIAILLTLADLHPRAELLPPPDPLEDKPRALPDYKELQKQKEQQKEQPKQPSP